MNNLDFFHGDDYRHDGGDFFMSFFVLNLILWSEKPHTIKDIKRNPQAAVCLQNSTNDPYGC